MTYVLWGWTDRFGGHGGADAVGLDDDRGHLCTAGEGQTLAAGNLIFIT